MGNWRTVNMTGKCSPEHVEALKKACLFDYNSNRSDDQWDSWHCLSFSSQGSLCGINNWVAENISTIGNLAERDYTPEDVAKTLEKLVKVAPSLELMVHCGGDYESQDCVATIIVKDGKVDTLPPQVVKIMAIPNAQAEGQMLKMLFGRM